VISRITARLGIGAIQATYQEIPPDRSIGRILGSGQKVILNRTGQIMEIP
jgi:hypothetical protein